MQTTQLYVELVIIGIEGSVGLAFAFIALFGYEKFDKVISYLNGLPATIITLGVLYIFGFLLDRFADMVFQKWEDKFRRQSGLQAKSVLVLIKNKDQINFLEFTRTRSRILRASIIITLFSTITGLICFSVQPIDYSTRALAFCGLLGSAMFLISLFSYRKMLRKYYDRARIIELESESASQ